MTGVGETSASQRRVEVKGLLDREDAMMEKQSRSGEILYCAAGVGSGRLAVWGRQEWTVRCFFLFPRLIMHPSRCAYETVWISSHHHIPVFESFLPHPDLIFITSHPTPPHALLSILRLARRLGFHTQRPIRISLRHTSRAFLLTSLLLISSPG